MKTKNELRRQWIASEFAAFRDAMMRSLPGETGIAVRRRFYGWHETVRVLHGVEIQHAGNLRLGRNVVIAAGCKLCAAAAITLEDDVLIGPDCSIWTQDHVTASLTVPILEQGYERDPVTIGKGCWIGCRSVILKGVTLPEGVVVAAGSVVTKSSAERAAPYYVLAGVPARPTGSRVHGEQGPDVNLGDLGNGNKNLS